LSGEDFHFGVEAFRDSVIDTLSFSTQEPTRSRNRQIPWFQLLTYSVVKS
jgi:hypothetical protein